MTVTILTRWKLLLNLSVSEIATLPSLFNKASGRTFIKDMGGRSSINFAPIILTCTTRFYALLRAKLHGTGYKGKKFPFRHVQTGLDIHMRFRIYGNVLVIEIERTNSQLPDGDILNTVLINCDAEVVLLAKFVLGLIKNPNAGFRPISQLPKIYYCLLVLGKKQFLPSRGQLVELLTRHRGPSDIVVESVFTRNELLQSDDSTLLIDRQGVLMAIPSEISSDETVIRRFQAACNMFEMVTAIERLAEQNSLVFLTENELQDIDTYFRMPDERFLFSTSSKLIWKRITAEFDLLPEGRKTGLIINTVLKKMKSPAKKIMLVTALDTEAAKFISILKSVTTVDLGEVYATRGIFESEDFIGEVYVCIGGVGNTQAAIETSSVWRIIQPDLTLFIGIAGGRKEATIGSVVIASRVYNYESGKERTAAFSPRPRDVTPSRKAASLITAFLATLRSQPLAYPIFYKPIACGEKVVGTTLGTSAQLIATTYDDSLAVEMEGFGFLSALEANTAPAILIRGISDKLDNKDQEENHDLAIENATDIASRLIQFFLKAGGVTTISGV